MPVFNHQSHKEDKMKTWKIEDASQLAIDNPTTFFTPSPEEIKLLSQGDIVKLIFYPVDPEESCGERMWVGIESANDDIFTGRLINVPVMQCMEYGELIEFGEKNIIDISADSLGRSEPYLKRCLVSNRVLKDGEMPHYIAWAVPENNIDSGWLILSGDEEEGYMDQDSNLTHIPLCMIVNHDDSFKHLLHIDNETAYYWYEDENEQCWVEIEGD
jgi:hypothetical protein